MNVLVMIGEILLILLLAHVSGLLFWATMEIAGLSKSDPKAYFFAFVLTLFTLGLALLPLLLLIAIDRKFFPTWRYVWRSVNQFGLLPWNHSDYPMDRRSMSPTQQSHWQSLKLLTLPNRSQSEPIIAYRLFSYNSLAERLASVIVSYIWDGPVVRNEHTPEPRLAVWSMDTFAPDSKPGFFAMKSKPAVTLDSFYVLGEVECFGTVIEHEKGYRAQGMVVRKLWVPAWLRTHVSNVIPTLERVYQCDVGVR